MTRLRVLLPVLGMVACDPEADVVWRQFNGSDDTLQIEVRPGEPEGLIIEELSSNTGVVVVGEATVEPARGPVGTEHTLLVIVGEDWAERVERASVTSIGERGEETYDLVLDTARAGVFELVLTSLGEPDESRVDTWRIELWEAVENPPPEPTEGAP